MALSGQGDPHLGHSLLLNMNDISMLSIWILVPSVEELLCSSFKRLCIR